jgi:hypothetical protein
MAGRAMQRSIVMGYRRIVVRADRIARTEALSFQGGFEAERTAVSPRRDHPTFPDYRRRPCRSEFRIGSAAQGGAAARGLAGPRPSGPRSRGPWSKPSSNDLSRTLLFTSHCCSRQSSR